MFNNAFRNILLFHFYQRYIHHLLQRYIRLCEYSATMPFVTSSLPDVVPVTGFGDFNLFAIYSFPSTNGNKFGIGPLITAPTGTHDLGSGKWLTGISALAFFAKSHIVQVGSLLQYSTSFAGDNDKPDIDLLTPQIFVIWQLGAGFCFRSTGIWSFNLNNGDYSVPIGHLQKSAFPVFKGCFNKMS